METARHYFVLIVIAAALAPAATCGQDTGLRYQGYSVQYVEVDEVRRMLHDLLGSDSRRVRIIADQTKNQLLVSGDGNVHRLATELLHQVDRPAALPQPSSALKLKAYRLDLEQVDLAYSEIRALLPPDAKLTVDRASGQILVVAADEHHRLIDNAFELRSNRKPSSSGQHNLGLQSARNREQQFPLNEHRGIERRGASAVHQHRSESYALQKITTVQCQNSLIRILNGRIHRLNENQYVYSADDNGIVQIRFDTLRNSCEIKGQANLVTQTITLLDQFEATQTLSSNESVRFISVQNISPESLQKAIRLWQARTPRKNALPAEDKAGAGPEMIQPIGYFQNSEAATDEEPPTNSGLRRPSSSVEVQPLPDLDVLILRGRDPDVEELRKIIQEIERLSAETTPEIELYHLQHVQDQSLNTLITQVLSELTGPLQGRISITPLVKAECVAADRLGRSCQCGQKTDRRTRSAGQSAHSTESISLTVRLIARGRRDNPPVLEHTRWTGSRRECHCQFPHQ